MGGLKVSLMMPGGGSKVEQEGFKAWQSGSKVLSKNFPDTTFRNYMLNVPAAWLVDALISSTAPARSKDKCAHTLAAHELVPPRQPLLIS
jgi:hypothetical protein